jgi:AraC-like DNA-binding protein
VALACGASEEGHFSGQHSLRAARLEGAKRYIDQHLAEPALTPASTAAALGISVRHLHLLFEPTGTSFAQYVARRRLLQCRAALTSPVGAGRTVADIAFGWGFNRLATFYRAFEREFGLPLTALRVVWARGVTATDCRPGPFYGLNPMRCRAALGETTDLARDAAK